jgi:hypothetical protein
MNKIEDGGSAYPLPVHLSLEGDEHIAYPGMSLRDWFAGQAITGVIRQCAQDLRHRDDAPADYFAMKAFEIADAMIAARKAGA